MRKSRNKIRLVDIAEKANLSVNTISKVLNGRTKEAGIALKTADRVKEIAKELGYVPDQMARCLRAKTTDTIGIYIDKITDHVRAEILHVILEELSKQGFFPLITLAEAGYKRCYEAFIRNRIEGLILCGTMREMGADFFHHLSENRIKSVIAGCFYSEKENYDVFGDTSFVNVDNKIGVELQIEHLREKGRSHIAFVAGPGYDSDMHERENAYSHLIKQYHEPIIEKLNKNTSYLEHGYLSTDALIKSKKKFDAIIAYDDEVALGVIHCLHEKGLQVPADVAVIGFDNSPQDGHLIPPLSSVSQPTQQIGKKSVEILLDSIKNGTNPEPLHIPPSLVTRESTL